MIVTENLDTIGRIIVTIKTFRERTGYVGDLFESTVLDRHLKIELSVADFQFWTSLRLIGPPKYGYN